jgi:hypothetical protein
MKRILIALAVAASLSAAAFGAAASLTVNRGHIQQGETQGSLQCDSNGVSIRYWTTNTGGTMKLLKVWVDDVDANCAGGELDVILKDAANNQLWLGQTDVPSDFTGGSIDAGLPAQKTALMAISPSAVEAVEVSIYDTYP